MAEKPADGKREKISKAQRITMIEVLVASLVLGTCLMVSIFMVKYINFNTKVITEKDEAILTYDKTLRTVGICVDKDKNGRLTDEELQSCDPNKLKVSDVPGTLRSNVLQVMSKNTDLESVARLRNANCYTPEGERRDFDAEYNNASSDFDRQTALQMMKICSALRVIPDALPAQKNTEALMASLNQLFIEAGVEPTSLVPRDDVVEVEDVEGVSVIPVTLRFEGNAQDVVKVLDTIDDSIREFDITTATVEWTSKGLDLNARANAYYLTEIGELESMKSVKASTKKKTSSSGDRSNILDAKDELLENTK